MLRTPICLVVILLNNAISNAQSASDSISEVVPLPVAVYYQTLGEQSPLYNAREYVDYTSTINIGHPFYNTTEFVKASILFDGMYFENVMILYDIIKDKVILQHYNKLFRLDLPVTKIQEFTMLDHHFIRMLPDSNRVLEEGFYDKIYQGKTPVYVKRRKLIRIERTGNEINNVVDEKDIFYILKQGVYYPVKNLSALLHVLSSRRDQIRQHLKKNGVKYRKQPEKAVTMAVELYDR